jgi:hypothetical protein
MEFDVDKLRPLEFSLLDRRDEGGISWKTAQRRDRSACDALFVMELMLEAGGVEVVKTGFVDGKSESADLSARVLFRAWVSMAAHIAKTFAKSEDPEIQKRRRLCAALLAHMNLEALAATTPQSSSAESEPPASQGDPSAGSSGGSLG